MRRFDLSIASPPRSGIARISVDQKLVYTPDSGFFGADATTYRIRDADGDADLGDVIIDVQPPAPMPTPPTQTTPQTQTPNQPAEQNSSSLGPVSLGWLVLLRLLLTRRLRFGSRDSGQQCVRFPVFPLRPG